MYTATAILTSVMLRDLHNHTAGSRLFYSRMQRISPHFPPTAGARLVTDVSTSLDVGYYSEPSTALNHFRFSDK